jgi:hypothetical protein
MIKPLSNTSPVSEVRLAEQNIDWESLISQGLEARENKDNSQWILGDLSLQVEKNYGEDSIGKFAIAINEKKTTIVRYRTVSSAWPVEKRVPYLSHRHHQILASRNDRFELIEKASDGNWSVEELTNQLKKIDGTYDDKLLIRNVNLNLEEIELILEWYTLAKRNEDRDIDLFRKMENHSRTIKERVKNERTL